MKNTLTLFLTICTILFSCTDEDPTTPNAIACFETSPDVEIKAGAEVSFSSCAEDATLFAWDFGDGSISTDENPTHIFEEPGTYTIKFGVANETSADTVSQTIDVGINNFFSINGVTYDLDQGLLQHNLGKWHSLGFVDNRMSTTLKGIGNIVCLDILAGNNKYDIVGSYSLNLIEEFDGTDEEAEAMSPLTIYNGFCSLAHDYSFEDESPEANDLVYTGDESYSNFTMTIGKTGNIYDVAIDVIVDGKNVKVRYTGELQLVD